MVKRTVGRRPKLREMDTDTRTDILASARRVFARAGFDGASMREVAKAARVNNAMIYYHFHDKKGLYRAVLSDSFSAMDRVWESRIFQKATTARQKIKKYIGGFIRFQRDNEDLRRILAMEFSASGLKGANMKWIAKHYFSKNHARLAGIVEQGIRDGELKKVDSHLAVVSLIGMIIHSFLYMPIAPSLLNRKTTISSAQVGAVVTEIFFDGLCASPRGKKR